MVNLPRPVVVESVAENDCPALRGALVQNIHPVGSSCLGPNFAYRRIVAIVIEADNSSAGVLQTHDQRRADIADRADTQRFPAAGIDRELIGCARIDRLHHTHKPQPEYRGHNAPAPGRFRNGDLLQQQGVVFGQPTSFGEQPSRRERPLPGISAGKRDLLQHPGCCQHGGWILLPAGKLRHLTRSHRLGEGIGSGSSADARRGSIRRSHFG